MSVAGNKVSLGPESAAYLVERYDTQPHPLLRVGQLPFGTDDGERRKWLEEGRAMLKQQGLISTDEVHPFLEDAWHLLSHPPLAVGMAMHRKQGEDFNAVFVEQGRATIRAYQADGETADALREIVLDRNEYGGPTGNAVGLLGGLQPGTGGSASLPVELFEGAGKRLAAGQPGGLRAALASAGVRQADAQVLANATSAERSMECVFTARAYDSRVRRVYTLPTRLQVLATTEGSYLIQRKPGGDGREWYTLAPTDDRKLAATIEEALRPLRAPARR